MKFDIVAIGELLIDFTPEGKNSNGMQLLSENPGGAPTNVLALASKLKQKTAFIGKVGEDHFGYYLKQVLENANINTLGLVMSQEAPTTLAFVHLDETGDRTFTFYRKPGADTLLRVNEINQDLILASEIVHFGSLSLTNQPSREATEKTIKFAKEQHKIISYDPNFRPMLWASLEEAKEIMGKVLPLVDILKVSDDEMFLLTGKKDLTEGAEILSSLGPKVVFISLGAKGAFYYCNGLTNLLPTYDVKTIDTTGSGDAFLGALLYKLRGKKHEELAKLSQDFLNDSVDFANAAGSLVSTMIGAIPAMPTLEEIETCRLNIPLLIK